MSAYWSVSTRGDPLGKVRELITQIWSESNLEGMLVTMEAGSEPRAASHYATSVDGVAFINPFKPLMEINAARLIPGLLADHPGVKIGALLRPCELRALTEMVKHAPIITDPLLTISVDCLGTLPADEYQWRLDRAGKSPSKAETTSDELSREALKFARQGGIVPYRYRSACQVCTSPAARQAHINIHVLGLPVRQQILVSAGDNAVKENSLLEKLADGKADTALITQHERVLSRMGERHQRTMERISEGLRGILPEDVDSVIRQLEACGDCQVCLDVCPICSVDRPVRDPGGHYARAAVMRWLVSCAGCGMCEQACPNHLPLAAIFSRIRQQLAEELESVPGGSVHAPLPIN